MFGRGVLSGALRTLLLLAVAVAFAGCLPPSGDGWRQIYAGEGVYGGTLYDCCGGLAAALDDDAYAALWSETGATQGRPKIDFDSEIVALLAIANGQDCDRRLTGVTFSGSESVRVSVEERQVQEACSLMPAPAWIYVIALSRSKLYTGTFRLAPIDYYTLGDLSVDLAEPGLHARPLRSERGTIAS